MPFISHKRAFLAQWLRGSGLLAAIERWARRPGLLVLNYHRIGDPTTHPFYAQVASATPESLHDEMTSLARSRRIVTLEEAVALAQQGLPTRESLALVTFDDGYRDNVTAGLPVLSSLGIPATFFLTTDFIDGKLFAWWDHIAYVVNTTKVARLKLERPVPMEIDLTAVPRSEAILRVIHAYLDHPTVEERPLRSALESAAEVSVNEPELARALFMTWEDARTLNAAGMSIGAHTVSHRALALLPEPDQRHELAGAKQRIEAELSREVIAVAYPYGWPGTFDATTTRLTREAGYRAAFLGLTGVNRPGVEPFALYRMGVGFADPPGLHRARWALHEAFGKSML